MGQMQRRVYSVDFKREVVRTILKKGVSVSHVARRYGINENILRRWKRQIQQDGVSAFPGKGRRSLRGRELHRLKEENRRLLWEREILKRASMLLREPSHCRYAFIHEHRAIYPVRVMCDVLNVSRSGYYAYAKSAVDKGLDSRRRGNDAGGRPSFPRRREYSL